LGFSVFIVLAVISIALAALLKLKHRPAQPSA
jgi:hypothetical protein